MNIHSAVKRERMLIGGELVASEADQRLESINPANEEVLGHVPQAMVADVNRAVAAAEAPIDGGSVSLRSDLDRKA